ncbi:MAG TPA: hypothetical protein PLJ29_17595, partial [Leptospiraceae bacterium]|nr:hypothetical protein [Leptospiraceae bacterium]
MNAISFLGVRCFFPLCKLIDKAARQSYTLIQTMNPIDRIKERDKNFKILSYPKPPYTNTICYLDSVIFR